MPSPDLTDSQPESRPAPGQTEIGALAEDANAAAPTPAVLRLGPNGETESVGQYKVVGVLGRGGMGVVYEVIDQTTGGVFALKTVETRFLALPDANAVQRFAQEILVLRRLDHPGVVRLFDSGFARHPLGYELAFLVMEKLSGETLDIQTKSGKRFDFHEALHIVSELSSAIEYLGDNGVLHRDIKPGNIFLDTSGRVVLMDFGLARSEEFTRLTLAGQIVGTLGYMSPERLCGKPVDISSDIYALGVVLYQMLTTQHPFGTGSPSDLVAAIQGGIKWSSDFTTMEKGFELRRLLEGVLNADRSKRPSPRDFRRQCLELMEPENPVTLPGANLSTESAPPIEPLKTDASNTALNPHSDSASGRRPALLHATHSGPAASSYSSAPRPLFAERPFATAEPSAASLINLFVHTSGPTWLAASFLAVVLACPAFLAGLFVGRVRSTPDTEIIKLVGAPENGSGQQQATQATSPLATLANETPPKIPRFRSYQAAYDYAEAALNQKDYVRARYALHQALELNLVFAEAHRKLGDAYTGLNDREKAIHHYKTYLALKPNAPDAEEVAHLVNVVNGAQKPQN